jgi:cbb3-type cytochrome oxidase maturation protein
MSVLYIMLPAALFVVGLALFAFIRAALSGQYDDLESPALRILPEDDGVTGAPSQSQTPRPPPDRR